MTNFILPCLIFWPLWSGNWVFWSVWFLFYENAKWLGETSLVMHHKSYFLVLNTATHPPLVIASGKLLPVYRLTAGVWNHLWAWWCYLLSVSPEKRFQMLSGRDALNPPPTVTPTPSTMQSPATQIPYCTSRPVPVLDAMPTPAIPTLLLLFTFPLFPLQASSSASSSRDPFLPRKGPQPNPSSSPGQRGGRVLSQCPQQPAARRCRCSGRCPGRSWPRWRRRWGGKADGRGSGRSLRAGAEPRGGGRSRVRYAVAAAVARRRALCAAPSHPGPARPAGRSRPAPAAGSRARGEGSCFSSVGARGWGGWQPGGSFVCVAGVGTGVRSGFPFVTQYLHAYV